MMASNYLSHSHLPGGKRSFGCPIEELISHSRGTDNEPACHSCGLILQAAECYKPGWMKMDSRDPAVRVRIYNQINLQRIVLFETSTHEPSGHVLSHPIFSFDIIQRPSANSKSQDVLAGSKERLIASSENDESIWVDACQSWNVLEDSSTQVAFDRAAMWLSHCVKHDKACEPPNKDFVPRRLLNVGHKDEISEPFLFEPTEPLAYACLSYCWGENIRDVLTTTTSNLDKHYRGIPLGSMPKSVQDAVRVCRGLGILYLWVDSLCIVQNDYEAWRQDASMMDRIYLNSHVTISALEPSSCKTGFLGKQKYGLPGWQRQLKPYDTTQEIIVRPEVKRTMKPALDKRAWCLQETLLPCRRLCFDGNEMSWECLCRKLCECGHHVRSQATPGDILERLSLGQLGALMKKKTLLSAPAPQLVPNPNDLSGNYLAWLVGTETSDDGWKIPTELESIYELWRTLVSRYSLRLFSRRSDKLIAIEGLANIVRGYVRDGDTPEDEYLAGLWKKELPLDLAWRVTSYIPKPESLVDEESGAVREEESFPSWSWASCHNVISYDAVQRATGWKYSPELIATTEGGSIRFEGKLVPVELAIFRDLSRPETAFISERVEPGVPRLYDDNGIEAFVREGNLKAVRVYLDELVGATMTKNDPQASCWIKGKCAKGCCSWDKGDNGTKTEYYCFKLFSWLSKKDTKVETWFLLLRSSRRVEQAFERIGVGLLDSPDPKTSFLFESAETQVVNII
ncbi:HET-domain-containing protein [Annulohypoxylon bovei var. microspora]|nr:HET-domain-containing protein [Annulohypoxylon bovei var. microspora]